MKRVTIRVVLRGTPAKDGRVSHDLVYTNLKGVERIAIYYANPEETVKRLRHNMAEQYWFDKMRIRLAKERHDEGRA